MFNYKIKITVFSFFLSLSVMFLFQLVKPVGAITVDILDSDVVISQDKIKTYTIRKNRSMVNFSSTENEDFEFSTVYIEILGKNLSDPNGIETTIGTNTSFFVARTQTHYAQGLTDYWPLNFEYKDNFSKELPGVYLIFNNLFVIEKNYDPGESSYEITSYNFYIHLIHFLSDSLSFRFNADLDAVNYKTKLEVAKVNVPISLFHPPYFFKSHPQKDANVSAIKIDQIFQEILSELMNRGLTNSFPYYFAFDIDNRHKSTENDFIFNENLKVYGYPRGCHASYVGIARSGHLSTNQSVFNIENIKIGDFCTDMVASGESSGSPLVIENIAYNTKILAGVLYAGPPNNPIDSTGFGLKIDKIYEVSNF